MPVTKPATRKPVFRDSERTKANILAVARKEFANRGLHGARVESIAARTRTTKRMIYYYFAGGKARNSSKEQLYTAVLEAAYSDIQANEQVLGVDHLDPRAAICKLVEFSFDYYDANPEFIRLVITENIHEGKHLRKLRKRKSFNPGIIAKIVTVLARGQEQGMFHTHIDPVDLHLLINSFCFFRVSNRYTFGDTFKQDLGAAANKQRHKALLGAVVLSYLGVKPA